MNFSFLDYTNILNMAPTKENNFILCLQSKQKKIETKKYSLNFKNDHTTHTKEQVFEL